MELGPESGTELELEPVDDVAVGEGNDVGEDEWDLEVLTFELIKAEYKSHPSAK